ncbi:hypothetical protein D7Z26_00280 [Cohnella endophytica]|uniref:DUF4234 domain-containing protein n=1 Tax=Cohnella endophytica TaxID=2419778 RepID=A0A494Y5M7_9BACL|nr:DUF4234 domain-containing protein [Cohnella endophytica]RKP57989.1 hypothetical protein D7Z26_00280 [Cohnella endophytica]
MDNNDGTIELVASSTVINKSDLNGYCQPVWHFVFLSVLTFGLYDLYWYYRNWKYLKKYKGLNISPVWRTIGILVPIFGLYLIYSAHKDYHNLIKEEGVNRTIYPGLIVVAIIITGLLTRLPDPYWLLCFLSTIPLAIVQKILNELWRKVQPGLIHRTKFRGRQIFLIVIGVIWWLLAIIGMTVPE